MKRPRPHHRAALTEAIAEAIARFQADVRRLARTVLRGELDSLVTTLEPTMPPGAPGAGTRAEDAETVVVVGRRGSPMTRPRKAAAATTSNRVAAAHVEPVATARVSKSGEAVRTSKPTTAARTSKPGPARRRKSAAARAEPPIAEPPIAEPPIAEPVLAVVGTPEDLTMASVELDPGPAVAVAVPEDPKPKTAGLHPESAAVAESGPAATHEELPWRERAQAQREERAQRRKQRQERARIRREEAVEKRIGSAAAASARAAPAAPVHEEVPGPDGTRAMGLRMQRGIVKWFNDAKGYGFIQGNDGVDVFVHRSGIVGDGFRTLHEGQTVEYVQAQSGKGLLAVDVVPAATGAEEARR
jgi:CspA family cold shock protein